MLLCETWVCFYVHEMQNLRPSDFTIDFTIDPRHVLSTLDFSIQSLYLYQPSLIVYIYQHSITLHVLV